MTDNESRSSDFSEVLKELKKLFSHNTICFYLYHDCPNTVDPCAKAAPFYRISAANMEVKLPRAKNTQFPEGSIVVNIWGDNSCSAVSLESLYTALYTLNSMASILTVIGYDIYVNDRIYDPMHPLDRCKMSFDK